jgi:hypothetical protein
MEELQKTMKNLLGYLVPWPRFEPSTSKTDKLIHQIFLKAANIVQLNENRKPKNG